MNRRDALKALALLATLGVHKDSLAIGASSKFGFAKLEYSGGDWNPRDGALRTLLLEVEKRTSIAVEPTATTTRADSEDLFLSPFLVWTGTTSFDPLSDPEVEALALYLRAGGFLLIDSADETVGGAFDRTVRAELSRILPSTGLEPLSTDHVIFRSFYMLDQPWGRTDATTTLEGISQDDRLLVAYCQNDLQGAWARDHFGTYLYDVVPGGKDQRELSFRFGINCVMYALCVNYKADQVHIPFILKRRKWKVE